MMSTRLRLFALALSFVGSAIVFAQDQSPAPSFKEGDTWQFSIKQQGGPQNVSSTSSNDGTYELIFTQGNIKLYKVEGTQKNELLINQTGPTQGLLTLIGKSDQRANLKFPVSVGQKWTYAYRETPAGGRRDQNYHVDVSVAGMEQITTPAGTFKAYKLVADISWGSKGRSAMTYFYSPETRSIVKRSSENEGSGSTSETELIRFTPGN
jgi:hypothetical protein